MEINKYIKELLFQHDCVIIPGFGGFVTNYQAAEIKENINSILPPSKIIGFNKNLIHNDGLLINFIAISCGINFEEAKDELEKYVKKLRERLIVGGKVQLPGIGTFKLDEQENIQFEPGLSRNYLLDSYGLIPIDIKELVSQPFQKPIYRSARPLPYQSERTRAESGSLITGILRDKKTRAILFGLPLLLTISLLPFSPRFSNIFKVESAGFDPSNSISKTYNKAETDSGKLEGKIIAQPADNKIQPDIITNTGNKKEIIEQPTAQPADNIFLIAGSFMNINNAKKFCNEMIAKGYNSKLLTDNNGMNRVSVFSTNTEKIAKENLNSINSSQNEFKAWILIK
ncbi:hypothetical protein ACFLTI_07305 [Bacteroidota bacterium]